MGGKVAWRREWPHTPLPGKCHGQRSLAGYIPWGCKASNMTGHARLGLVKSPDFTNVFLFPLPQGKKLLAGLVLSSSVGDPQLACQYACVPPPFKNHSLSPSRGLPRRLHGKTSNLPFCNGFSPVHLGNGNQGGRFTHVFVVSLPHWSVSSTNAGAFVGFVSCQIWRA